MSITDIAMPEDLNDLQTEDSDKAHAYMGVPIGGSLDDKSQPPSKRRKGKSTQETSDARRESHKLIEQKRRQKINEKINELRELLNYPDGSQNKAVVLQAAVENIRYLKMACNKLLQHHRALQDEHAQVIQENERLRKIIAEQKPGMEVVAVHEDKLESGKSPALSKSLSGLSYPQANFELSEVNFLYGTDAPNQIPFSPSLPSLSRGYVTGSSMIPSINSIQLTGANAAYGTGFTESREGIAPNTPTSTAANTATPTNSSSPLTSTETENGVSITRLLDYRL